MNEKSSLQTRIQPISIGPVARCQGREAKLQAGDYYHPFCSHLYGSAATCWASIPTRFLPPVNPRLT